MLLNIKCKAKGIDAGLASRIADDPVSRRVAATEVITSPNHTRASTTARRDRRIFCAPFKAV